MFRAVLTLLVGVVFPLNGCVVYVSSEDADVVRSKITSGANDQSVCSKATVLVNSNEVVWDNENSIWVEEAANRGLNCTRGELQDSPGLQMEKNHKEPSIKIISTEKKAHSSILIGKVSHLSELKSLTVDGKTVAFDPFGNFSHEVYAPPDGRNVIITATNFLGKTSSVFVSIERSEIVNSGSKPSKLNPMLKDAYPRPDSVALIVGIGDYEKTSAEAIFADRDAMIFSDYVSEKLGVHDKNIKILINEEADISGIFLNVKRWLLRAIKQKQSDVYVFFAGHGLASDDGEKMYLLPYDGAPELLDKTAILRDELFSDIAAANPRSVTVFLDTCYSGTTRGPDMLIASRPIAIRAKEQAVPEGFTVMTAAAGDQTAKPLEEAKHGMFSYFLMKGMEGDADTNQDNQITAGELHAYVQQNVIQQSSGSQTPELQGDADRVLVRFQ